MADTFEEIDPLTLMVQEGRLFDVQKWIAEGKPVNPPNPIPKKQRKPGPLEVAIDCGFHSMVQILVEAGANMTEPGPNNWTRFCSLADAVNMKRMDLVELLIRNGADIHYIEMMDVYETWDPAIMRYFIDRGVNPTKGNALAIALSWRIRTALGICKQYKKKFPEIQEQMDIALRYHTYKENKKWISLMLWAGADPYSVGVREADVGDADDRDCALEIAVLRELEWFLDFKQVKLDPRKESARQIFESACHFKCGTMFGRFVDAGFADQQTEAERSELIQAIIDHMTYEPYDVWQDRLYSYSTEHSSKPLLDTEYCNDGLYKLEKLFDRGWKWSPDLKKIRSLRRSLLRIHGKYFIGVLKLARAYKAASRDMLQELTRTPTARARLFACNFNPDRYLESITW